MLADCGVITTLYLDDNRIDDRSMDALGNYLKSNRHLTTIKLTGNRISIDGVKILGKYLQDNETLRYLILLSGSCHEASEIVQICADLVKMSRIESLSSFSVDPYQTKVILIPAYKNAIRNGKCSSISLSSQLVFHFLHFVCLLNYDTHST